MAVSKRKNKKIITNILSIACMVVAVVGVFGYALPAYNNAKNLGISVGDRTGTIVGNVIGSFDGITTGLAKGAEDGPLSGLFSGQLRKCFGIMCPVMADSKCKRNHD